MRQGSLFVLSIRQGVNYQSKRVRAHRGLCVSLSYAIRVMIPLRFHAGCRELINSDSIVLYLAVFKNHKSISLPSEAAL